MNCFFNTANLIVQVLIAIGTVGALFAALHQIKKNREQFDQERKERNELQSRCQADNVAAWFVDNDRIPSYDMGDMTPYAPRGAMVLNGNTLPIYNVVISVVSLYGAGPASKGEDNEDDYPCRLLFHEITPGTWGRMIRTHGASMGLVTTLEIAFTDSMGQNWIRRGNGILEKIDANPLEYYRISFPPTWDTPLQIIEDQKHADCPS